MSVSLKIATFTVFLAIFKVSDALRQSFNVASNILPAETSENQLKIDLIDVRCDKDENGMHVTIQFEQPFGGVIYSQNYFNDPKCRFVADGENQRSYSFVVPFTGCGSKRSCVFCNSIENILVIQQDEELQSGSDIARKVSCSRNGVDEAKRVYFKPFVVDMLDVVNVPTSNGSVNCWMDIQRGIFPQLTPIGNVIKIGEELTVLVFLQDRKNEYDLTVRNCWAYNNVNFDDKKTGKVQLSDASGCSMKKKLFGSWQKTSETGSSDATLLLHNVLRAFRFPDESQIYLKCDIEICHGTCAEAICDDDFNDVTKLDCKSDPLNSKCLSAKFTDITRPTEPSIKLDDRQEIEIESENEMKATTIGISPNRLYPDENKQLFNYLPTNENVNDFDKNVKEQKYVDFSTTISNHEATTLSNIIKTDTDLPDLPIGKQIVEIIAFKPPSPFARKSSITPFATASNEIPLICRLGNLDPRCPNPTPTATPSTYLPPSSTDSRILTTLPMTIVPATLPPRQTPSDIFFICVPGSNDVRCDINALETTQANDLTTTESPTIDIRLAEKPVCNRFSSNPECKKVSSDILTLRSQTTTEYPIITTNREFTTEIPTTYAPTEVYTSEKFIPTVITTSKDSTTELPIPSTSIPSSTRYPFCYPGSFDPRCQTPTTTKPVSTPTPEQFTSFEIQNTPSTQSYNQLTDVTRSPTCYPGALDPRCQRPITEIPIFSPSTTNKEISKDIPSRLGNDKFSSTLRPPACYPGALDPRCHSTTTTTTIKPIPTSAFQLKCYPGSPDPRCETAKANIISTESVPFAQLNCINGQSQDPRCPSYNPAFQPAPYSPSFADVNTEPTITTTRVFTNSYPTTSTTKQVNEQGTVQQTTYPTLFSRTEPSSTMSSTISTTTTRRILSSPQPFQTRSPISSTTTTTTTENALCYPGSPIAGCETTFTTPSFCYPGSKDKRCPQLPKTFSTRQPATYLPPFLPDEIFNRVKRHLTADTIQREIVKFSLSFKPFSINQAK